MTQQTLALLVEFMALVNGEPILGDQRFEGRRKSEFTQWPGTAE